MTKEFLLAKSHFRKNRGTAAGIFLLMFLASFLLSISMILFTDVYPTGKKSAERLDSGDGVIKIYNIGDKDDAFIRDLLDGDVERYGISRCLNYPNTSVISNTEGAEVMVNLIVETSEQALNKTMARTEIIDEDDTVTEGYVYLPYQLHTSGHFEIGDMYPVTVAGKRYDLKIRGFLENTYYGCNNSGCYEIIVPDNIYDELMEISGKTNLMACVPYALKDKSTQNHFATRVSNDGLKYDINMSVENVSLSDVILSRTFMSLIIAVSFFTVTVIVMAVIIMMIANSIANYVKENMKTIGALKAIGYTGRNIRISLIIMFLMISVIASVTGIGLSYAALPYVAKIVVAQMGHPYRSSFSLFATAASFFAVVIFTLIATLFSARKVNRIIPIVALREGIESHNFKRNPIKLERSFLNLDLSLAMKTLFSNLRQNVIVFVVIAFLIFLCVNSLLMYENFSRKPNLKLMALEICSGVIGVDGENAEDAQDFLYSRPEVSSVRKLYNFRVFTDDEDSIVLNAFEDPSKMNNQDLCYKGRLPLHDNEICLSGRYAKSAGLKIGDEVRLKPQGSGRGSPHFAERLSP